MKAFREEIIKPPKGMNAEQVYESLKELIISGSLLPNQRLIEEELSTRFNVSRTPLREALRRLEAEGFVCYSKNKGFCVSYLSFEDLLERFIYFSNLLAFASSLSVEYIGDRELNIMKDYEDKMNSVRDYKDRFQWVAYNQSFHITLISACPNKYLLRQLTREGERLWRYWATAFKTVFDLDNYHREHREIIDLASKRDKEGIYNLVFAHTSRFSENIKNLEVSI